MRYTLTSVSGPARRLFKGDEAYDDRAIVTKARNAGLYVTRPNGSQRIRGSGRLQVWAGDRIVAKFERQVHEDERATAPVAVGAIKGTTI
jgi:hypothetical protein